VIVDGSYLLGQQGLVSFRQNLKEMREGAKEVLREQHSRWGSSKCRP
jgi:hypothetical protein